MLRNSPNPSRFRCPGVLAGLLLAGLSLTAVEPTRAAPPPGDEVRAMWVTRWDFRTEADVRRAIQGAAELGMNRVFLQVRGRGDAFYRSPYEPWGEEIGGRDPGFDPLAVAVDEARKRRVDVDAWVNILPGWKGSRPPKNRSHLWHRHPEWFLTDLNGRRLRLDAERYTIVNPCLPEVRRYLTQVVGDIASRYAVAGVHLDYIRFVARSPEKGRDFPYDARTTGLFERFAGGSPSQHPAKWDDWRRRCVNTVVHDIAGACRRARPGVRISVAAIADYERARTGLFQDVATWQRRGWTDEIFPMTYSKSEGDFASRVSAALAVGPPGKVFPGIGVYLHTDAEQVRTQISRARALGARGYALFALTDFQSTRSHESKSGAKAESRRRAMRRTVQRLNGVPLSQTIGK